MKTRIVIILILLLTLTVILTKNDERITDTLLSVINPVKQAYQNFTDDIENKSQSYIFQKEAIERLTKENKVLRERLLEQTHYIKQVKDIYEILPQLSRLPVNAVSITETISYVKLNSFSQIILTKPEGITGNKLYGLIQKDVVAGIAQVKNNQLFGYLTSDKQCRFSVFVGENNAPGIAEGIDQNNMQVKFIPKWHEIKKGDKVITSGLDAIFFENIPVGIVTKVELHSSYKIAHIKTYSDIFHPKSFFLINNATVSLTENFDPQSIDHNHTRLSVPSSNLQRNKATVSSIPKRIDQTQDDIVEPEALTEETVIADKIKNKQKQYKPEPKVDQLDLF